MQFDYEYYCKSADYVKSRAPFTPEIAIVLGSALGPLAEQLENPVSIDYADIPNFLVSTAPGHAGKLIFGTLEGKKLVCMSGRFHSYEGYRFEELAAPMRLMKLLGVQAVILTNAAGGVNLSYHIGDVVVLADHIKLNGASPMRGQNIPEFGERFFDVTQMYTPSLRAIAMRCAEGSGLTVHEGVYFFMPGPQFETPAEIRAIRLLGGDVVGMSTVTEALTAAHCGLPVLAMSVVTNMAAGVLDRPLTTEEVDETGEMIAGKFSAYLRRLIREMGEAGA